MRSMQESKVGLMDNRQQQPAYNPNVRVIMVGNTPSSPGQELLFGDSNIGINQAVNGWLNEIGLSEYYGLFINSGCDDMETILSLTDDDLKELGIHKLGHRKKIMNHIGKQTNSGKATNFGTLQ